MAPPYRSLPPPGDNLMLYDPEWNQPTEAKPADPLSLLNLDRLIAWLRTKPTERSYDWMIAKHCLLGQFIAEATGWRGQALFSRSCRLGGTAPFDTIALKAPYTFGAALDRALALRAQQQDTP